MVFEASKSDIDALIAGKAVAKNQLSFAADSFVKRYMQALKYISYAKYLEPYMSYKIVVTKDNAWMYDRDNPPQSVADLNYNKIIDVLEKSWNIETDQELKLRYGYQLVRFAHYYRNFDEAIQFFNKYVETLNYKPAMYFYALDQKAGAERGLGNMTQAAADFFTVFNNTRNIKSNVYSSMRFCVGKVDEYGEMNYAFTDSFFDNLLQQAKTADERNNIYLFLGYQDFNNPLQSLKKIISTSPDAIQARVLMARAINHLERTFLPTDVSGCPDNKGDDWGLRIDLTDCLPNAADRRLPIIDENNPEYKFLEDALDVSLKQAQNANQSNKDFWNTTTAYLYFLKKEYNSAKEYLAKVNGSDPIFGEQKTRMEMLIDICEQPIKQSRWAWLPKWIKRIFGISDNITIITPEFEATLFSKYKNVFDSLDLPTMQDQSDDSLSGSTQDFIIDILANRYYLQKDLAKSFLLQNNITALESNPNLDLITEIEAFYRKKNKSPMDKYLAENSPDETYLNNLKGTVYLAQGDVDKALSYFKNADDSSSISNLIFGYNRIESFESPEDEVMQADYLRDFPFIKIYMNKQELTEALLQLQKIAKKDDEQAAEANYLLGNFFYNTTSTGYYRHILRFDEDNEYDEKYRVNNKPFNLYGNVYLKDYGSAYYFLDNMDLPNQYLVRAMTLAKDDELRARIAFAFSKTEQEAYYLDNNMLTIDWYYDGDSKNDGVLISNRKYFHELNKYSNTKFYKEVKTNCLYFNYYVTNYSGK